MENTQYHSNELFVAWQALSNNKTNMWYDSYLQRKNTYKLIL